MPQVGTASGAGHLGPAHKQTVVLFRPDRPRLNRLPVAGPSGPGIKLGPRAEQFVPAGGAQVDPHFMMIVVFPGEGAFRPLPAQDTELLRGELSLPFLFGFVKLGLLGRCGLKRLADLGRLEMMRTVAVGILLQVLLVVLLGQVKFPRGEDLRDNWVLIELGRPEQFDGPAGG